jgi:hypothetical protein
MVGLRSPCRACGPSVRRVVRTEWSPSHTDRVITVSSVRTECSPRRADRVVAESYGPSGRRVVRTG